MALRGLIVMVALVALAASAVAQQAVVPSPLQQPAVVQQQRGATDMQTGRQMDGKLAQLLLMSNQEEIAVSQFAQDKAHSDAVKDFANMMIREHSDMVEKLQQFTLGPQARQRSDTGTVPPAGQTAAPAGRQDGSQSAGGAGMMHDPLMAVLKDAGQRCTALTQQELGRHEGAEFDQAYMGQQLIAHVDALAKLQAFQGHASGGLQQLIDEATQATQKHLKQARGIMEQLATQAASTARRPAQTREQ